MGHRDHEPAAKPKTQSPARIGYDTGITMPDEEVSESGVNDTASLASMTVASEVGDYAGPFNKLVVIEWRAAKLSSTGP